MRKHKNTIVDIGILLIVTLVAYFPVCFFIYSLKNDSLVQYLPFRYHLSESIQHGYFPFWSPYLYTGFPIHADMQGMTWNPIVLIISLFTRYNMSVLEFEMTIYLFLSAVGMYSLLKSFSLHRWICILGAISYMSCGFINGSASVIPWISSAAFIPFVFRFLKLFLENLNLRSAVFFSLSLSMLFLCGYPTFFIYSCYIIVAYLVFAAIYSIKKQAPVFTWKNAGLFLAAVAVFLCLCSPAIISYLEFLPSYSRGAGISVAKAAENPFTPYSSISFFLPNAVHKNHVWLNTDTSMRNGYVGIFVFAFFCLSVLFRKNKMQWFILSVTAFSFLLSLGSLTPLHKICYAVLPGFNTFRHPGNIRLFTSVGIILLAATYCQQLISTNKKRMLQIMKYSMYALSLILILPVIYSLVFVPGVIKNISESVATKEPKAFLDTLRFPSMLLIQAILQLCFLGILFILISRHKINRKAVVFLLAANSILFCWIALPFNFISQIKTKEVNRYVASFPDGYPLPDMNSSVGANQVSDSTKFPVYGYPNFYSKKITIQDYVITPTLNKSYEDFNNDQKLRYQLRNYPLAWLNDTIVTKTPDTINRKFSVGCYGKKDWKDSTTGSIKLVGFNPHRFVFDVNTDQLTILSLFQQYNQNWKVTINGESSFILRMNDAFIGVPVPAGKSQVVFNYRPVYVIVAACISLGMIFMLTCFFIFQYLNSRKSS